MTDRPTVFIVDDDRAALESLEWLLESVDLQVLAYRSPSDFLMAYDPMIPGCIVLDVRMPGLGGLELQEKLQAAGCRHPIIFVTGHGDVPSCSRAYKGGAFDFVEKPVNDQQLLDLVQQAIETDARNRADKMDCPLFSSRRNQLTPRESEVMELLTEGKSIKQIASELRVTFPTAARHRARVLEKIDVENEVELLRMVLASQPTTAEV